MSLNPTKRLTILACLLLACLLWVVAGCNDQVDLGKDGEGDLGVDTGTVIPDAGPTLDQGPPETAPPDAGTDAESSPDMAAGSCTPGIDQTCNDNPAVSALWGKCNADGSCSCNIGFEVNPATGRCRPVGAAGDCSAEIAALSAEMYTPPVRSCTAVVRLDHDTLKILGHQLVCGKYAGVDETAARATAQADTGYGTAGQMLNGANPEDLYVFYQAPGDFGGASAVSARTGLSVFGGSIIWLGSGDLTYPKTWRAASELGSNCPLVGTSSGPVKVTGYDLVNGQSLSQADADAAAKVVHQTAIPAAMWQGGYVFDIVVLRYPRAVGTFDPTTAEWIVAVNGGWLE